jgi:hypothetical protein
MRTAARAARPFIEWVTSGRHRDLVVIVAAGSDGCDGRELCGRLDLPALEVRAGLF